MWSRFRKWLARLPFQDPTERHMAGFVQTLLIGLVTISVVGVLMWATIAGSFADTIRPMLIGLLIIVCMFCSLMILRHGWLNQAVLVATIGLLLALWFNFNGLGVQHGAGLLTMFLLPITLAGFMSSRRGLISTIGLTLLFITITAVLEARAPELAGFAAPRGLPPTAVLIAFALVIALVGIFIDQGVSALRRALTDALARGQELERTHRTLEGQTAELLEAKEALERELAARTLTEAALAHERDLLHALMDNLPDMIYFKDTASRFTRINRAQARLLGAHDPNEVLGKTDFEYQAPELAQHFYDEEQQIVATGVSVLDRVEFNPTADGQPRWFSATKVPILSGSGQVIGIIGLSRDITERHEIERLKSEFIATVSHELRTPLTAIRGSLGLLAAGVVGSLPPKAVEMIELAYKNSERLLRLVNDLLDIEKIEAGKMRFRIEPVELVPLVTQAIAANRGFAEQYGVTLALRRHISAGAVSADPDRLMQVFANLLSNGAKFSQPSDTVEISIDRREGMLRVSIADRGPGIPQEFRTRIFGKFAQADSSNTRAKGGTGLGLSIAKAIVERMGGRIGFETEVGIGTIFYVDLPEHGASRRV
jgi:PAS domain S-box-containing protein